MLMAAKSRTEGAVQDNRCTIEMWAHSEEYIVEQISDNNSTVESSG